MIGSVRTSIALISQLRWINADRLTSLGPMERPDYVCDADGMDVFLESKPDAEYNARDEDLCCFSREIRDVITSGAMAGAWGGRYMLWGGRPQRQLTVLFDQHCNSTIVVLEVVVSCILVGQSCALWWVNYVHCGRSTMSYHALWHNLMLCYGEAGVRTSAALTIHRKTMPGPKRL